MGTVPGRRRPSPRLTAALAAMTLVIGGLAGAAIGPAPTPSLAATPRQLVALVLPSPAVVPTTTTTATDEDAPPSSSDDAPDPSSSATDDDTTADDSTSSSDDADTSSSSDDTSTDDAPAATDDDSDEDDSAPSSSTPATTTTPAAATSHVWLISLTQLDATTAFGPASPLADLVAQGTLLSGYTPVAPSAAANAIALLGGQVPTTDCAADLTACVRPAGDTSLPSQLLAQSRPWRAYVEDPAARCAAPNERVAPSLFTTLSARKDCATNVVGLDALPTDLAGKTTAKVPAFSLVVPNTCHDGRATPCADGAPVGLDGASPTVHDLVAKITASAAYRADGVLIIAPDAPPPAADPAAPLAATGALVLSARASAARTVATPTGPVALLRSLDELLGLDPLVTGAQAPAGALDGVLAPAVATASAASLFPHRSHPPITTRRSS